MSTIKKVLFLNPPDPALLKEKTSGGYCYFEPPLGLLYVYSYIQEHTSIDARFVDLNVDLKFQASTTLEESLAAILGEFQPRIYGLTRV